MRTVELNKNFNGNATIYGAPKSGKSHCAATIVREVIRQGRNVVWVTAEDTEANVYHKIYDGVDIEKETLGEVRLCVSPDYTLKKKSVEELLKAISSRAEEDGWEISMILFDGIRFGSYTDSSAAYSILQNYCWRNNIALVCTMQCCHDNTVTPSVVMHGSDFAYVIQKDNPAGLQYGDFVFTRIKKHPFKEDLFRDVDELQINLTHDDAVNLVRSLCPYPFKYSMSYLSTDGRAWRDEDDVQWSYMSTEELWQIYKKKSL